MRGAHLLDSAAVGNGVSINRDDVGSSVGELDASTGRVGGRALDGAEHLPQAVNHLQNRQPCSFMSGKPS